MFLKWSKQNLSFDSKTHFWFFLQGIFNFSINYMLTYWAETFIKSGVLAIAFTSMVYFNIVFSWFFFKSQISRQVLFGSLLGGLGILLIFKNDLIHTSSSNELFGLSLGLLAALSASIGNMVSVRNIRAGINIRAAISFAMLYGTLFTLFMIGILKAPWSLPTSTSFVSSLAYLSIFGTVVAFTAYNTLLKTLGADKAAYTTIISPVLAILLSYLFENLHLYPEMLFGIALCLLGNISVLYKGKTKTSK
ncbi:MAG: EamA family transporter [Bdellovibrionaceae bacterium]|nr:EamA family transporter [Pseudobdellovibrionaceae bacterium]